MRVNRRIIRQFADFNKSGASPLNMRKSLRHDDAGKHRFNRNQVEANRGRISSQ